MEARAAPPPDLIEDVRFALDHRRDCAIGLRSVLLHHFKNWSKDRLLGPPFELAISDEPDPIEPLVKRVVSVGGPSRHLDRVRNSGAALDHCAESYRKGLMTSKAVAVWRADIERVSARLADALDAADTWLTAWGVVASCKRPKLALLEEQELLGTEDLAGVLGIGPEAAARRRRKGEFGKVVVGKGRQKFVMSRNVRKALQLEPPQESGD